MKNIFESASKLVLILMAVVLGVAFLGVVFSNLKEQEIVMAIIAIASGAISSVFTFYFTKNNK